MDGERGSGAALRRRERRLRAWQRHVRTAVQLALAEKLHHSANKVVLSPYTAQCLFLSGTCYASVTEFLAVCDAPLAVFLRGFQALMPCIMAGLDQRDSYVVSQLQFIMVMQLPGWWSRHAENCGFLQLQFLSRR